MSSKNIVPIFILKTYQMLEDQMHENVISWINQGTEFIIYNQELLQKNVLQDFFKHCNYSSFLRQLNLYGFEKVKTKEGVIFKHNFFRKGIKSNLQFIQKKRNQEQKVPFDIQKEQEIHQKEKEQNLFKESAIDIKQTNKKLQEDMKLLQDTSSNLINQMQHLNQYIYNQNQDIDVLFRQVGQKVQAITEELKSENMIDEQPLNGFHLINDKFQVESTVESPNPYIDDNGGALNLEDNCFIDQFK